MIRTSEVMFTLFAAVTATTGTVGATPPEAVQEMLEIPGGEYRPMYTSESGPVPVAPFSIDAHPVTNAAYLDFVRAEPRWRRDRVPPLLAEPRYLSSWTGPLELGPDAPGQAPVTFVSWFAARAYCAWRDKRLPTLDEWELVALASETQRDASDDPAHRRRILDWYSRPTARPLPSVMGTQPNVYGVYDLHGLVWEWVSDWNSLLVTGESRGDGSVDPALYCAGASANAADPSDYAAFLRYAMRASLEASYTVRNVGFRCAKDAS